MSNNLALALSNDARYNSGYDHGCSDGKQGGHYYLSGTRGAAYHTAIFMQGYNDGYAACSGTTSSGTTSSGTTSSGTQGNIDFIAACKLVAPALYYPCSMYVKPDGSLTQEGHRAFGCIKSGFALGLGGILLSGGNVPAVTLALGLLAGPTGCGNVVHLDLASGLIGNLDKLNTLKSALGIT